jgi:Ca2+-transporting ATPase
LLTEVTEASVQEGVDVVAGLATDAADGLTAAEVAVRLGRDGPNELPSVAGVPRWRQLLGHLHDPLIYLLLAAVGVSVIAWLLEGASGLPVDALVITAILVANSVIGYLQESRAEAAVDALRP